MAKHEYIAPNLNLTKFDCPHCGSRASFEAENLTEKSSPEDGYFHPCSVDIQVCAACDKPLIWLDDTILIYPKSKTVPMPHDRLPDMIKNVYNEAAAIACDSPRAAAALMRVCTQMLLKELGESGTDPNKDIGELVSKGLDPHVQKAFDINRIIGNSAVHPEQIILTDAETDTRDVFLLFNFIADDHYARIARREHIDSLYAKIPAQKKQDIHARELGNARKKANAQSNATTPKS